MSTLYFREPVETALTDQLGMADVLICASGSDIRCQTFPKFRTSSGKALCRRQVVIEYDENIISPAYQSLATKFGTSCKIARGSVNDIECFLLKLRTYLEPDDRIVLDITGITKPLLFSFLRLCRDSLIGSQVHVVYTEPARYIFGSEGFTGFNSTEGTLVSREIPGYNGSSSRDQDHLLVLIAGFDGDLAKFIVEDLAPEQTVLVNGFPAYQPKFKDISLISNEKILGNVSYENDVEFVDAGNPFDVYNCLEKLSEERKGTSMTIAPLGSKPMALGAALFALEHHDVRVVYPTPRSYKHSISADSYRTWAYDITPVICTNR